MSFFTRSRSFSWSLRSFAAAALAASAACAAAEASASSFAERFCPLCTQVYKRVSAQRKAESLTFNCSSV